MGSHSPGEGDLERFVPQIHTCSRETMPTRGFGKRERAIGIGLTLGLIIGAVIGSMTGNIGLWVGVGVVVGILIGVGCAALLK